MPGTPTTETAPTTAPAAAPHTARLVLRPGVHVAQRDAGHLQVGLHPHRAVLLPDLPAPRRVLDALACGTPLPLDDPVVRALTEAELVVEAAVALPLCGGQRPGPVARTVAGADAAALTLAAGDLARRHLDARAGCLVEVRRHGPATDPDRELGDLLVRTGLPVVGPDEGRGPRARRGRARTARVGVLVSTGEPTRDRFDDWLRSGTPHLVVRLHEGELTLGPFVEPGETACLRCLDAHHADTDPAWPLVVAQHADAADRGRADGLPTPVDSALATLACGWAARDLATFAEGGTPSTRAGTVRLGARLTGIETQRWTRHPACGCGWR